MTRDALSPDTGARFGIDWNKAEVSWDSQCQFPIGKTQIGNEGNVNNCY